MSHPEIEAVLSGALRWCVVEGDNADFRASFPKSAAIVSDPPYGIGYQHSGGVGNTSLWARTNDNIPIYGDDRPFDPSPWIAFDNVLLWGADHFRKLLPDGGTIVAWDKSLGIGPSDSFADGEFAWTSAKVKRNVLRVMWKGVACQKRGETNNGRVKREHPTQKPITLMKLCISALQIVSDSLIIDPYCGSGTTGVAAVQMGYRFIGIEREPKYCAIARRRIADAAAQGNLFGSAA